MRRLAAISFLFLTLVWSGKLYSVDPPVAGQEPAAETTTETPKEETATPPAEAKEGSEAVDNGAEEGEQPLPTKKPAIKPPAEEGLDDEGYFEGEEIPPEEKPPAEGERKIAGPYKITIDAVIMVKYTYSNSNESYTVKYHINMGGELKGTTGIIKANAKVATDISGFLAKSSAFECLLKVSIADVPCDIIATIANNEANLGVTFKGQILEDWQSLCTFLDTSGAKFNTRGNPEKWIGTALEKAKPPLTKLSMPVDSQKPTTLKFVIAKYTIQDEGLGSADIDGTGVVTIQPERQPKENTETASLKKR